MEKNIKLDNFLKKAKLKNGNKYDYSKAVYINSKTEVSILCLEHNILFNQKPTQHTKGIKACNLCKHQAVYTTELFIDRAKLKHGNRYDYSKSIYIKSNVKTKIICNTHGEFEQLPINHMLGQGCPKCGYITSSNKRLSNTSDFINKANLKYNNKYDYSNSIYVHNNKKVKIICPTHGEFEQLPSKHLNRNGCYKCTMINYSNSLKSNIDEFIKKSKLKHGNKYDYSKSIYIKSDVKTKIICPIHGEFEQIPYDHIVGHGCSKCTSTISIQETNLNNFITSLGVKTITSNRTTIKPQQLDILISEKKIAIEYDGLYWHSEEFLDKNYHLNKTNLCKERGLKLIHIFSDEWLNKREIVESRLKNILNINENKIYARKCVVKEVNSNDSKLFFDVNHIQGFTPSKIKLGLYLKDELVSIMMFNKQRIGIGSFHDGYELTRFCSLLNLNVIGGASKLFKYFINNFEYSKILSYADKRWSTGDLYYKLGFNLTHTNIPSYSYITGRVRKHRFNFRKSELIKQGFDKDKSEKQIMFERKIYRIYDCGTMCFEYKNPLDI